jgi:predicted NBD/HSP70 family sugar kinase
LATVASLFDPRLIVIAGGVGENTEQLRPFLESSLATYAPTVPEIRSAELGHAAALLGGITLALPMARDLVFERLATRD